MPPVRTDVDSWPQLVACLQKLELQDLACRGQAKVYKEGIRARIDRCLKPNGLPFRLRMERASIQRFREHAPTYLSGVESRYLDASRWLQLVVMQHYGAPTRLLDWTKSPWIAAFFAVFGEWELPGHIYIFRRSDLEKQLKEGALENELRRFVWGPHLKSEKDFSDPAWDHAGKNDRLFCERATKSLSPWVATFYSREGHFPRLIAQQGLFTFASKPDMDHWAFIRKLLGGECNEITIQQKAKLDIVKGLANMGLTGATLFPGADGIGRSLEGFVRTWLPPGHR